MELLLLLLGLCALSGGSDKKCKRKKKRSRYKSNDSWLDAAWFHDHNQSI